jgi:hypothetical protein
MRMEMELRKLNYTESFEIKAQNSTEYLKRQKVGAARSIAFEVELAKFLYTCGSCGRRGIRSERG